MSSTVEVELWNERFGKGCSKNVESWNAVFVNAHVTDNLQDKLLADIVN